MRKQSLPLIFILLIIMALLPLKNTVAQEKKPKKLKTVEFLSGFGWGKLRAKDNYNIIPLLISFDFDLKPLLNRAKLNPSLPLELQLEPYLSLVTSPDSNIEGGASIFVKVGLLPENSRIQPYFKIGAGLNYMTQHTFEQSTQCNFNEQAGIGMHYYLRPNTALTIEGRYRHLSNAGIDHPNQGIDTAFTLIGIKTEF